MSQAGQSLSDWHAALHFATLLPGNVRHASDTPQGAGQGPGGTVEPSPEASSSMAASSTPRPPDELLDEVPGDDASRASESGAVSLSCVLASGIPSPTASMSPGQAM